MARQGEFRVVIRRLPDGMYQAKIWRKSPQGWMPTSAALETWTSSRVRSWTNHRVKQARRLGHKIDVVADRPG